MASAIKHLEAHCRHNGYPFTGITVDDAPVNHSAEVRDFLLEKASNLSIGAAMEHRGNPRCERYIGRVCTMVSTAW